MSQKKRKYQDYYLSFGFTYVIKDGFQIPQCVLCMKTFSNSTMKLTPLKQHLVNAHSCRQNEGQKPTIFEVKTVQPE